MNNQNNDTSSIQIKDLWNWLKRSLTFNLQYKNKSISWSGYIDLNKLQRPQEIELVHQNNQQ